MIDLRKMFRSFKFAFQGIYFLVKNENNARVHLLASFLVVAAGFYFAISTSEWLIILLFVSSVWASEAINSAIEKLCDEVDRTQNRQIGMVKDMAAAGVLFFALGALVAAAIIFLPKILTI